MKTVNLKKETKKAKKMQEKANNNLQRVIKAVELTINADNLLLNALKKMETPLSILMDDSNDFEKKAKAFNSLYEYFSILREIMEISWSHGNDYGRKYDKYDDSMYELINLGIVNAINEKSAETDKLEYFETPEEVYDTIKENKDHIKWISDL